MKPTPQEKSWILYDVANSAFVLIVITTLMPVFFKEYAAFSQPGEVSTWWLGVANSTASLLLALSAPFLGAAADARQGKKKFLFGFMTVGVLLVFSLMFTQHGMWVYCLSVYVGARFFWSGANIFYDALLHDVTTFQRADRISARGYAWGYVGSVIPFLLVLAILLFLKTSEELPAAGVKTGFAIVGIWWVLLSIPLLKTVHPTQAPINQPSGETGISRLRRTLTSISGNPDIRYFLVAYFFYIDGVNTIISMASAYGKDIGLDLTTLILAILMIQVTSFPFTLFYGRLSARFGTKPMLFTGIGVYGFISLFAFFLPVFSPPIKTVLFWVLAFLIATSMGGIQALSRSFFMTLAPPDRSAEYFGFYNMFGKVAAVMGPFLMGLTGKLAGHSRWGVLTMLAFFLLGAFFLAKVKHTPELFEENKRRG
ncbi:MAG: MFS transporter [Desulfobacteraceae bacterium]